MEAYDTQVSMLELGWVVCRSTRRSASSGTRVDQRRTHAHAGVGPAPAASPTAERAQASHDLVDRDEPVSHVAIALLDQVRIDSDGVRLLAQRGQVDLDPQ
jgi:hypothetical protein